MQTVEVFRDLEQKTEERKSGDPPVCCIMNKEYQDLIQGLVRVLRYKESGGKYTPQHVFEGTVEGRKALDDAKL